MGVPAQLKLVPHDYQEAMRQDAARFFADAKPGDRRLYSSPTGTGKSVMELLVLLDHDGLVLLTTTVEIIAGLLDKLGYDTSEMGHSATLGIAERHSIYTIGRYKNLLANGNVPRPRGIIVDEAHHDSCDTLQQIYAMCGMRPRIGLTASPFRGTPKGTAAFHSDWGDEIVQVLTYPSAVRRGLIAMPKCEVVPLLDDDTIEVRNGEIVVRAAGEAVMSRADAIVQYASQYVDAGRWDRPTMFSVPSRDCAADLASRLNGAGKRAVVVDGDTKHADRQRAFDDTLNCRAALVQINVVSEGVDLPIRRLIDCNPTLSPVRWLQQVGRIMRPGGESHYVCTNRNLIRHAYLLEGMVPPSVVAAAQKDFGVSDRDSRRSVGFEGLGKFKPTQLPLANGTTGIMYALQRLDGSQRVEYAALASATSGEVLYAERTIAKKDDGTYDYDAKPRWRRIEQLPDMDGFASLASGALSEAQAKWWKQSAKRHGLNPDADVNRKNFQVLPILRDLGCEVPQ
jgi:superfamily II DNA or RNA helicase